MLKTKTTYYLLVLIVGCLAVGGACLYNSRFKALESNPVILMVFNGEYSSEAENSFASIKKNAPELIPNVTICVSDESSRNFAIKHNLQYFELSTINETGTYLSVPMNIMGRRKIECILHVLRENKEVLYTDTDIVFNSNPINQFNAHYDLNIQADECYKPYTYDYLCTGFMYVRPNAKTLTFFQDIIAEVVKREYAINDQNALDIIVKDHGLLKFSNYKGISINVLDVCKFPNGCRYFDRSDKDCRREQALIIHNNHIVGIKNKYARFEKHGLIFTAQQ